MHVTSVHERERERERERHLTRKFVGFFKSNFLFALQQQALARDLEQFVLQQQAMARDLKLRINDLKRVLQHYEQH